MHQAVPNSLERLLSYSPITNALLRERLSKNNSFLQSVKWMDRHRPLAQPRQRAEGRQTDEQKHNSCAKRPPKTKQKQQENRPYQKK